MGFFKSAPFPAAHEVLPILEAFNENPQRLTLVQDLGLFTPEALRCERSWEHQIAWEGSSDELLFGRPSMTFYVILWDLLDVFN